MTTQSPESPVTPHVLLKEIQTQRIEQNTAIQNMQKTYKNSLTNRIDSDKNNVNIYKERFAAKEKLRKKIWRKWEKKYLRILATEK